jgi:hypothetical protein
LIGWWLACGLLFASASPVRADASACLEAHADAQRARMRGELLHAREQLIACAQAGCPALVANDCTSWLSEVEASLPSVVFAVVDGAGNDVVDVTISSGERVLSTRADGKALLLDPGPYELRFEALGYAPQTISITARQAEKNRSVSVRLAALDGAPTGAMSDDAGGIPTLSYVLGGVALASLGTGLALGLYGQGELEHAEDHCAPGCTASQVAAGKRAYVIADVAFGVSIASALAAVVVYFVSQPDEQEPTAPVIDVSAMRDGAAVRWTASY